MAESICTLHHNDVDYEFPVVIGSEGEFGIDISQLRARTGLITLDEGYGNTGSCRSAITFIDGDKGILRHRGIPIEQLAEHSTFIETAMLVIYGELPNEAERAHFSERLTRHSMMHESLRHHFEGFPHDAPPMAILSAMINALGCYHDFKKSEDDEETFLDSATTLLSQVRTIAAATFKMSIGQPMVYPRPDLRYVENFLHMLFTVPYGEHVPDTAAARAINLFLLLHADHEQNCSTSTVRMIASSGANMFASCAGGVSALWGPLHGGANVAVIEMLEHIRRSGMSPKEFLDEVRKPGSRQRLMGFGHRVYRNFDPRSRILKNAVDNVLDKMHVKDPLLDIARELEDAALRDDYFVSRKLFPNVDFYSGILLRAVGIPLNMFTVMFAIGRMPGWIANYREIHFAPRPRLNRPRQIYTGPTLRDYIPREQR